MPKIENNVLEKGIAIWKYMSTAFSDEPSYKTYKELTELKAEIEGANRRVASMPEFSDVRQRAMEYA